VREVGRGNGMEERSLAIGEVLRGRLNERAIVFLYHIFV